MFYKDCTRGGEIRLAVLFTPDDHYESFKLKLKKLLEHLNLSTQKVYAHVTLISSRGSPGSLCKRLICNEIIDCLFDRLRLFYAHFKSYYDIKDNFEQFLYEELMEGGLLFIISNNLNGPHELCSNFTSKNMILFSALRNNKNDCIYFLFK